MKFDRQQSRFSTLERRESGDSVSLRAALSTESPVQRFFGTEILVHTDEAIDLSRANDGGLPLTVNHSERDIGSPSLPIGRVNRVRLEDGTLRGDISFDTDDDAQAVRGKVDRGVARDISLTYRIDEFEGPDKNDIVRATRWTPVAASIVTVPADPAAGIGRSLSPDTQEGSNVDPTTSTTDGPTTEPTSTQSRSTVAEVLTVVNQQNAAGVMAGREAERDRLVAIDGLAAQMSRAQPNLSTQIDALAGHARSDLSVDVNQFRAHLFDLLSGTPQPLSGEAPSGGFAPPAPAGNAPRGFVVPGNDHSEMATRGMEFSLLDRSGHKLDPKDMTGNNYRGWSMMDIARECLTIGGIDTRGMSAERVAKLAIGTQSRAISPGTPAKGMAEFPAVTANVATKRVFTGFDEAERTWDTWCDTTEVPDFRAFDVPRLSAIEELPTVAEKDSYLELSQNDAKETATLVKKGGLLSLSWEAIVSDDMRMFSSQAALLGESAQRTIDIGAYAVLTTNGNMGDGNPLFDALHSNTGTAALDKAGIISARVAMGRQTNNTADPVDLGIILAYILVPLELQDDAMGFQTADNLPIWNADGTAEIAGSVEKNTLRGTFTTVATARLKDANDWYATGRNGQSVMVAFLNGNRQPMVETETGWNADSLNWKVRMPFVALAKDWRGMYRNVVT